MHGINSITELIRFITSGKTQIALDRIGTSPLEKKFGMTRLHAQTHQTMPSIMKTMEIDEAMKNLEFYRESKKRKLHYGQIISPLSLMYGFDHDPQVLMKALLMRIEFPIQFNPGEQLHECSFYLAYLMKECIIPYLEVLPPDSVPRNYFSLSKELLGVKASSRQVNLSAKALTGKCITSKPEDQILLRICEALHTKKIFHETLKMITGQTLDVLCIKYDGEKTLKTARKKELISWITVKWKEIGEQLIQICLQQNII
jgi:hypothetical protein